MSSDTVTADLDDLEYLESGQAQPEVKFNHNVDVLKAWGATVSGGGGGGSDSGGSDTSADVNVTPDAHPASPTVYDDEFEGSLSSWTTTYNPSSAATIETNRGALHIHAPTDGSTGSDNNRIVYRIERAVPSGSWTIAAKVRVRATHTFNLGGIWVRNGAGAAYITECDHASGTIVYGGQQNYPEPITTHTDLTSTSGPSIAGEAFALTGSMMWLYLRAAWDGTHLTFSVSPTGYDADWTQVYQDTPANAFGASGAPQAYGLCCSSISSVGAADLYCDWIRRTA